MSERPTGPEGREYSRRLGRIAPPQFQAALARFHLGEFVEACPVSGGLFGQNVFVTSTEGQYVLRGCPHTPWQFPKECFGAALLHQRTRVPVPHPYLLDPSTDIFGWPYILMPRLSGISPSDDSLTDEDRVQVARAVGRNLAQMHELTWPFAGEYDLTSDTIQPFGQGYAQWFISDVRCWLAAARGHGAATTDDDAAWTERLIGQARCALDVAFRPCFVMQDYKPGNVIVDRADGEWRVSGLFDLMEYYLGDGEADLMRSIAGYLDRSEHQGLRLARAFGAAYLERRAARPGFAERYALYMLRDRLILWEYGTRPGHKWFPEGQSFRQYAERYVLSYHAFEGDVG